MTACRIPVSAKILAVFLALLASGLAGCKGRLIQGLKAPDFALSAPASLPRLSRPNPLGARRAPAGSPDVPRAEYTLDPGDGVRIMVFGQQGLSNVYNIGASGTVSFPLIGAVPARGLTTTELARRIALRLASQYVKDPKVTVEVVTYRPFYILGHVAAPGHYPYALGLSVENAVAIAQGFKPRARKRFVRLTRKFDGVMSTVTVPMDYPVQPGDTIYVLKRFF